MHLSIFYNTLLIIGYSLALVGAASSQSQFGSDGGGERWSVIFQTGKNVWSGTNSRISLKLHGELGHSNLIYINPSPNQMEYGSIDRFTFNIDSPIGILRQITVNLLDTNQLFPDWELTEAQIIDPRDVKYVFKCNCFLTRAKSSRVIPLSYSNLEKEQRESDSHRSLSLILLLVVTIAVVVLIAYVALTLLRKWKGAELTEFIRGSVSERRAGSERRDGAMSERTARTHRDSDDEEKDDCDERLREKSLDKPPEYKQLFPHGKFVQAVPLSSEMVALNSSCAKNDQPSVIGENVP